MSGDKIPESLPSVIVRFIPSIGIGDGLDCGVSENNNYLIGDASSRKECDQAPYLGKS